MASWNGLSFDSEQSHALGIGLGLPAAFPRSSSDSLPRNGQSNNTRFYNAAPVENFEVAHSYSSEAESNKKIYTLTDTDLALAASSTLTPTAGEFIPRSMAPQVNKRKQQAPQQHIRSQEPIPRSSYNNSPQNKRQDSRYSQSGRTQDFQSGRGGFDTNQRRYHMENAKSQDRQRVLSETAALLTAMSNPEPVNETTSHTTPREYYYTDNGGGGRYRNEGNFQPNREPAKNNFQSGRNVSKHENNAHRRYQEHYDKGNQSQQSDANWRGNNRAVYAGETFTSSRGVQPGRQAPPSRSHPSSPQRDIKETFHANKDDDASQRERLIDQLSRGTLECLVCCDRIKQQEATWSCAQCYHVLHLKCVKKWAFTSKADNGWRCPACQLVSARVPSEYTCFCGRVCDPEWNRQDVAHSCGDVCNKSRAEAAHCVHRCTLLCHPGPCPRCTALVKRECGCGTMSKVVKCGGETVLLCDAVCGKLLNCEQHRCASKCHVGPCEECDEKVEQVCHCSKSTRSVACTVDSVAAPAYSCSAPCERQLKCGNHACMELCHFGPCADCLLTPDAVKTCPCGKASAGEGRKSCLDEVPTCGQTCSKRLKCGQPNCPHECQVECHVGPCPPCDLTTLVRCRCGNMDKEIPCTELTTKADDARCTKKCSKKRACGKHKCHQLCCIDLDHVCPLTCNHQLSCGRHRCEMLCHKGHCKPCHRVGWEELFCECRQTVMYPPIPCGTRPPECLSPCSRPHPCDHPVQHLCHSHPPCPPCTVFTSKHCYGNHLLRKNVPCYLTDISCGLPCDKELPCGRHKCNLPCHPGECLKPGQRCVQPCATPRNVCGHACSAPCHEGVCPDVPCKEMVKVTCECGHRSVSRACAENSREYHRIATSLLASKMADMQLGHTVDLADLGSSSATRRASLKTLECNEECRVIERNRRLAIGLQIVNPDLSAKLTPRYSEFMRGWAKKDPHFCQMIHSKLTELVQLAKQSKQKSRSYSFEPMNRDKRHFVHECCEHFGCQSEAYDPEPKRNVVATAVRDKAWLPGMSLLEVIQRENGVRKIPKPVINQATNAATALGTPTAAASNSWRSVPTPSAVPTVGVAAQPKPAETIDYFDFTS